VLSLAEDDSKVYLVGTVHQDLYGLERLGNFLEYCQPQVVGLEEDKTRIKIDIENGFRQSGISYDRNVIDLIAGNPTLLAHIYSKKHVVMSKALECMWELEEVSHILGEYLEFQNAILKLKIDRIQSYEFEAALRYHLLKPETRLELIDLEIAKTAEELNDVLEFENKPLILVMKLGDTVEGAFQSDINDIYKKPFEKIKEELDKEMEEKAKNSNLSSRAKKYQELWALREEYMAGRIRELHDANPNATQAYVMGIGHIFSVSKILRDIPHKSLGLLQAYEMASKQK
jgi:pheromone shutdown protein TraB